MIAKDQKVFVASGNRMKYPASLQRIEIIFFKHQSCQNNFEDVLTNHTTI